MSHNRIPACFVEAIDSKRGQENFDLTKLVGRVIFEAEDVVILRCQVEGCGATMTIPENEQPTWEEIDKRYQFAKTNCLIQN